MNIRTTLMLALSVILLASCRQGAAPAASDMAALRAELQQHTQQLMMVHFKLDNALQAVSAAEVAAGEGDCAGAGYHATDAYRELQAVDDELLAAGLRLQQRFNLDAAGASGN